MAVVQASRVGGSRYIARNEAGPREDALKLVYQVRVSGQDRYPVKGVKLRLGNKSGTANAIAFVSFSRDGGFFYFDKEEFTC